MRNLFTCLAAVAAMALTPACVLAQDAQTAGVTAAESGSPTVAKAKSSSAERAAAAIAVLAAGYAAYTALKTNKSNASAASTPGPVAGVLPAVAASAR